MNWELAAEQGWRVVVGFAVGFTLAELHRISRRVTQVSGHTSNLARIVTVLLDIARQLGRIAHALEALVVDNRSAHVMRQQVHHDDERGTL